LYIQSYSLDEASLDISEYLKEQTDVTVEDVAKDIQKRIFDATQLTCSIGCATTRMLAKICADKNKPNGFFRLYPSKYWCRV
jgi:nucleotidyltransferase/DNA polymerase involved in DNA repair